MAQGRAKGQSRSIEASGKGGPRHGPAPRAGHSGRHVAQHRASGRAHAAVATVKQYIGLIHKEPGSDYGVSFPDFPGVVTAGRTLDEARAMAQEALEFHIEGLVEDGEATPDPSSLEQVMAEPANRDGVAILVPAGTAPARAVRVNVTLPEDVLARIDRHAKAHGFTRSGFLAQAAKRAIEHDH